MSWRFGERLPLSRIFNERNHHEAGRFCDAERPPPSSEQGSRRRKYQLVDVSTFWLDQFGSQSVSTQTFLSMPTQAAGSRNSEQDVLPASVLFKKSPELFSPQVIVPFRSEASVSRGALPLNRLHTEEQAVYLELTSIWPMADFAAASAAC